MALPDACALAGCDDLQGTHEMQSWSVMCKYVKCGVCDFGIIQADKQ